MVSQPSWLDNEQTILCLKFLQNWTLEEYEAVACRANEMILSRRKPVYVISQFAENQHLPKGFFARAYKLHQRIPPNQVINIIVGSSPIVRSTFSILQRVFVRRNASIRLVNTLDDAVALCSEAQKVR